MGNDIRKIDRVKYREEKMKSFLNKCIAHRGLFDNDNKIPENSLLAFNRAAKKGYPIELDVQLTKDAKLVVFHDDDLLRMCGVNIKVKDLNFSELREYNLLDTDQKIPLFTEVLKVVDKRVPLLIEIKSRNRSVKTARILDYKLASYKGEYCIESFSPKVVSWYKMYCPEVIRGQLLPGINKKHKVESYVFQTFMPNILAHAFSKPDFLAYNRKMPKYFSYRICRLFYKGYYAVWTIKDEEQLEEARKYFNMFIFDSFIPNGEIVVDEPEVRKYFKSSN